jgi:hypothetical protein
MEYHIMQNLVLDQKMKMIIKYLEKIVKYSN